MIWLPLITAVFGLNSTFSDENGKAPAWLVAVTGAIFQGMWTSYDGVFFKLFGDGERSGDEDEDEGDETVRVGSSTKYDAVSEKGKGGYEDV